MSDSVSLLTALSTAQAGKEQTVNELFASVSHSATFGRRQSSSGLGFDYFGGRLLVDGVSTAIANGSQTLTASATNYFEVTRVGVISKNTTGFTAGSIALYKIITGASTVTSYEDHRPWTRLALGRLARSITADANITLSHDEALNDILEFTSSVSLTATRDVVLPLPVQKWTVKNATTGGQSLRFIGATGTGITVANGATASIYANGTNIILVAGGSGSSTLASTDDLAEGSINLYFTTGRALTAAPAETTTTEGALINGATSKATPVDADYMGLMDSAAANILKKVSWANVKATIKTYFDTLYATAAQPYDIGGFYPGVPTASVITCLHVFNRTVTFATALAGSNAAATVAATAQTDFDVQKNGASVGTIRFAAAATTATFISGSGASFAAGDILKVIAPATPDATLANITFTLVGVR